MSSPAPVRKKRNFKALALSVDNSRAAPKNPTSPSNNEIKPAVASRAAPSAPQTQKRKPPAMDLSKTKTKPKPAKISTSPSTTTRSSTPGSARSSVTNSPSRSSYHSLSERMAELDVGSSEKRPELKQEDFRAIRELGAGNGGSVSQVEHIPTQRTMAKKVVMIDAKPDVRKQILRELQIMHNCNSPRIISFYGAFVADPHICICMEYMDRGSLDGIYKKHGPIPIGTVSEVCLCVLEGLTYLYDSHRIIHRDIKPSNILLNSQGQVKLCDFGVSGELINSVADTFVGTSTYMSPERILGAQYSVKSDVWSLGITLIELALGRFPFSDSDMDEDFLDELDGTLSPNRSELDTVHPGRPTSIRPLPAQATLSPRPSPRQTKRMSKGVSLEGGGMMMSILELLQHIVNEPAPRLVPENKYPKEAVTFLDMCLFKDPEKRPTPKELLLEHWMDSARLSLIDLQDWAASLA